MLQPSTFQVYNASAGSGKTFTLVKEYLKVVLQSEDRFVFQRILAITFTNKAAAEMKERVLENLHAFSKGTATDILLKIVEETTLDKEVIQQRSGQILEAILQNYSAFGITTIDSFTYKIIKNFAYDLGLNLTFEVELDAATLLSQAVDVLISKIGIENDVTKILIDFSLEKANEDTSWDISRDLNEFAKILLNENDADHFKQLSKKTVGDFIELKNNLTTQQKVLEKRFHEIGNQGLEIIESMQLNHNDFYRSMLPKHFLALSDSVAKAKFFEASKLREKIEENLFYAKSKSDDIKTAIEGVLPELLTLYLESETCYQEYLLHKLALKSVIPLAVLTKIHAELIAIKEEGNIRLITEFNQLISDHIKDQPEPFIYERIGQKFMHYFIDEMQDTSVLQWQNLIPLIDNALAQEHSNLLLVGDGKQAIYRWRGGKAAQFINLGSLDKTSVKTMPFQVQKEVKELATNYRSYSEIIQFNNRFFQHVAGYFQNQTYQQLFANGNSQKETAKKGGYISIDFLEKEIDKEENELKYAKKVLEIIENLDADFLRNEVCVLVRKKEHAITIANYLSEHNVEIVSSETLLLQNSKKVNFIIHLLQIIQHPNDKETFVEVLYFLYNHLAIQKEKQLFFEELTQQQSAVLFAQLPTLGISFDMHNFHQLPFYEKIEEIIRSFQLATTSDAYLQFFLDLVFDHQRKATSVQEFLDFWELKKNTLSIVAPEAPNAVQIMTIHKSKGLEFPVVIFPYDIDIYFQKNPKAWLSNLPSNHFNGFDELLIPSTKDIQYVNSNGAKIYQKQREELELDNFNLLYVAFTRTVEQLYVVTDKKINKNGVVNTNYSSGVLIEYLQNTEQWSEEVLHYSFGNSKKTSVLKPSIIQTEIQRQFISTSWKDHNIHMLASSSKLWDTEQGKAVEFGNLIHEMMSKITTEAVVEKVVNQYVQQGVVDQEKAKSIMQSIRKIVNHPKLEAYYSEGVTVFNEREISTVDHQTVIPDRLVFNKNNEVTIIDYKTGISLKKHHQQLLKYEQVLKSMNFKVLKKLLIYIGEIILVEEI
ncbi:MAG: UvrD-helicase domain-containing protein [Polaribacter sp.]|nr:UvrD-helicase domain-containing protein [Polaribacter sp.]